MYKKGLSSYDNKVIVPEAQMTLDTVTYSFAVLFLHLHTCMSDPYSQDAKNDSNLDRNWLHPFNMQLRPNTDNQDSHPGEAPSKQEMQHKLNRLTFALRSISNEMTDLRKNLAESNADPAAGSASVSQESNEILKNIEKWAGLNSDKLAQGDGISFEEFFIRARDQKDGKFKPAENLSPEQLKHAQGRIAELLKVLEKRNARLSPT